MITAAAAVVMVVAVVVVAVVAAASCGKAGPLHSPSPPAPLEGS